MDTVTIDELRSFADQTTKEIDLKLLVAVHNNNIGEINQLIKDGANVNVRLIDGYTPLYIAYMNDRLDIVKILADNGAVVTEKLTRQLNNNAISYNLSMQTNNPLSGFVGSSGVRRPKNKSEIARIMSLFKKSKPVNSVVTNNPLRILQKTRKGGKKNRKSRGTRPTRDSRHIKNIHLNK